MARFFTSSISCVSRRSRADVIRATALVAVTSAGMLAQPAAVQAQEVGSSAQIRNIVTGSQGDRRLGVPDPVFRNEVIASRINSHGELLLTDNSRVVVGENSSVTLDDFVVGGGGFARATIGVSKGALRLITGNSAKDTFTVTTPTATIGSRGTEFDVYAIEGGPTRVVLYNGAVDVCDENGANCQRVDAVCDIVQVNPDGSQQTLPFLRSNSLALLQEARDYYLAAFQGRFQPEWRVNTQVCSERAATQRGTTTPPPTRDFGGGPDPDGDFGGKESDPESYG